MVKSHLKMLVLKLISKEPLSGYSLMKKIKKTTGCWKPSTGSIYPLLESLRLHGKVQVKEDGRKKVYRLTSSGREELISLAQNKQEMVDDLIGGMHVYSLLFNEDDFSQLLKKAYKEMKK